MAWEFSSSRRSRWMFASSRWSGVSGGDVAEAGGGPLCFTDKDSDLLFFVRCGTWRLLKRNVALRVYTFVLRHSSGARHHEHERYREIAKLHTAGIAWT